MTIYPDSQPTYLELIRNGAVATLMDTGTIIREAICGPRTGVGGIPGQGEFSIRHNTRNFIYREGARPSDGQHAWVALMDARSIAATAANKGVLTSAEDWDVGYTKHGYHFAREIYEKKVYNGWGTPHPEVELLEGPNIKPWPTLVPLSENILIEICSYINDPVTTTDELIPSGDTSSYRSNPLQMSKFTLRRRDPDYVNRAETLRDLAEKQQVGKDPWKEEGLRIIRDRIRKIDLSAKDDKIEIGSAIYARKPGDGSAREQAASCQRILGGIANFAEEYATKRYRSNLINWGIIPFTTTDQKNFECGDFLYIPEVRRHILTGDENITAYILKKEPLRIQVHIGSMSEKERQILAAGGMINFMRDGE